MTKHIIYTKKRTWKWFQRRGRNRDGVVGYGMFDEDVVPEIGDITHLELNGDVGSMFDSLLDLNLTVSDDRIVREE